MYTPGIIQRFGEDVKKTRSVDGEEFLQAVKGIEYERVGKLWDFQVCVGSAVEDALRGTRVGYLASELNRRVKEFLTEEERMLETEALEQPHKSKVWRLILRARLQLMEGQKTLENHATLWDYQSGKFLVDQLTKIISKGIIF